MSIHAGGLLLDEDTSPGSLTGILSFHQWLSILMFWMESHLRNRCSTVAFPLYTHTHTHTHTQKYTHTRARAPLLLHSVSYEQIISYHFWSCLRIFIMSGADTFPCQAVVNCLPLSPSITLFLSQSICHNLFQPSSRHNVTKNDDCMFQKFLIICRYV